MSRCALALALVVACVAGCGGRTGVLLTVDGAGIVADQLRISATAGGVTTTRLAPTTPSATPLDWPQSLLASFDLQSAAATTFHVDALDAGAVVAGADSDPITVQPGRVVDGEVQLSGATSVGDLGPPASPSPSPSPSPPDLGAPGYGSIVLADHPIAWYRLDDVSVAHDSSAANVSAAYGGQVARAQPGLVRGDDAVALFPGAANSTNDEIVTRSGSATIQPASISIELWLSQTSVNPDETALVVYDSTAPVPPWVVYIAGDRIQFQVRTAANVNGVNLASATTLVNDTTYHVVATFDGTTMSLYVNGALDASTSLAGAIAYDNVNYTLAIGGAIAGSNTPAFSGKLGEVALYDTALSAARVAAHAQAGRLTP